MTSINLSNDDRAILLERMRMLVDCELDLRGVEDDDDDAKEIKESLKEAVTCAMDAWAEECNRLQLDVNASNRLAAELRGSISREMKVDEEAAADQDWGNEAAGADDEPPQRTYAEVVIEPALNSVTAALAAAKEVGSLISRAAIGETLRTEAEVIRSAIGGVATELANLVGTSVEKMLPASTGTADEDVTQSIADALTELITLHSSAATPEELAAAQALHDALSAVLSNPLASSDTVVAAIKRTADQLRDDPEFGSVQPLGVSAIMCRCIERAATNVTGSEIVAYCVPPEQQGLRTVLALPSDTEALKESVSKVAELRTVDYITATAARGEAKKIANRILMLAAADDEMIEPLLLQLDATLTPLENLPAAATVDMSKVDGALASLRPALHEIVSVDDADSIAAAVANVAVGGVTNLRDAGWSDATFDSATGRISATLSELVKTTLKKEMDLSFDDAQQSAASVGTPSPVSERIKRAIDDLNTSVKRLDATEDDATEAKKWLIASATAIARDLRDISLVHREEALVDAIVAEARQRARVGAHLANAAAFDARSEALRVRRSTLEKLSGLLRQYSVTLLHQARTEGCSSEEFLDALEATRMALADAVNQLSDAATFLDSDSREE